VTEIVQQGDLDQMIDPRGSRVQRDAAAETAHLQQARQQVNEGIVPSLIGHPHASVSEQMEMLRLRMEVLKAEERLLETQRLQQESLRQAAAQSVALAAGTATDQWEPGLILMATPVDPNKTERKKPDTVSRPESSVTPSSSGQPVPKGKPVPEPQPGPLGKIPQKKKGSTEIAPERQSPLEKAFGLCNAPATFQRLMEKVLAGLQWEFAVLYIDDIVVFGFSVAIQLDRLETVLDSLRRAGLKCTLLKPKVEFLGHVVSAQGVEPDPKKIPAVVDWEPPMDISQLWSFVGLCTYYRRFVLGFSDVCNPSTASQRGGCHGTWGPNNRRRSMP
jgi:hypothetical protein